jgi:predicted nuclease with TOPRIM domain
MATDYTQWQPEALAQIIAFREKSMEQFAERIASLEADNARLRERADAAEGLRAACEKFIEDEMPVTAAQMLALADARRQARAALAAYQQAQGK